VESFLRSWGYLGIFLGILATGLGFPMPEELPIVVGGALAGPIGLRAVLWIAFGVGLLAVVPPLATRLRSVRTVDVPESESELSMVGGAS